MPETPAEELRAAVGKLRTMRTYGDLDGPLAALLVQLAEDMRQREAVEGSASKAVHPSDFIGLSAPREDWTAALAVARVINGGA